jgi:hypothetical protein
MIELAHGGARRGEPADQVGEAVDEVLDGATDEGAGRHRRLGGGAGDGCCLGLLSGRREDLDDGGLADEVGEDRAGAVGGGRDLAEEAGRRPRIERAPPAERLPLGDDQILDASADSRRSR